MYVYRIINCVLNALPFIVTAAVCDTILSWFQIILCLDYVIGFDDARYAKCEMWFDLCRFNSSDYGVLCATLVSKWYVDLCSIYPSHALPTVDIKYRSDTVDVPMSSLCIFRYHLSINGNLILVIKMRCWFNVSNK